MRIADRLSWCECDGAILLLDIEADRYFRLSASLTRSFRRCAAGELLASDEMALLSNAGLVEGRATAPWPRPSCAATPVCGDLALDRRGPRVAGLVTALWTEGRVVSWLRRRPLAAILARCGRATDCPPREEQVARAARIASAFARTAFIAGRTDRCLARAIACHIRCQARQVASTLVFGVRAHPFQAHAWVQLGGQIVVGEFEQARIYVPILAVP